MSSTLDWTPAAELTPREREVAALVVRGLSNRQLAEQLAIAEKTAKNHVQHVLEKLDFRSRIQLMVGAHEGGWAERLA